METTHGQPAPTIDNLLDRIVIICDKRAHSLDRNSEMERAFSDRLFEAIDQINKENVDAVLGLELLVDLPYSVIPTLVQEAALAALSVLQEPCEDEDELVAGALATLEGI